MKRTYKKLTIAEVFQYSKELWQWLSKNPTCSKSHWPDWGKFDHHACNCCFACEYVFQKYQNYSLVCSDCPFLELWGAENCVYRGSIYKKWLNSQIKEDRSRYAKQIVEFCNKKLQELNKVGSTLLS